MQGFVGQDAYCLGGEVNEQEARRIEDDTNGSLGGVSVDAQSLGPNGVGYACLVEAGTSGVVCYLFELSRS